MLPMVWYCIVLYCFIDYSVITTIIYLKLLLHLPKELYKFVIFFFFRFSNGFFSPCSIQACLLNFEETINFVQQIAVQLYILCSFHIRLGKYGDILLWDKEEAWVQLI